MKPLSLQLYSVRADAEKDYFGTLKVVAEIGYKGVEMASLYDLKPAEIRKVVDDLGLAVSSAHVALPTRETLGETVDTAQALGHGTLVSGKRPEDFASVDAIKAAADSFQEAAELLKPHGIRMGYHNHWWEVMPVEGRPGYEIFLERAPDVFSQLDVYWAAHFGDVDVPALIRKHVERLPCLHIKDGPLVEGEPHTAVGAGKMDIPACVEAADPDVLEWLIIALAHCATDMLTAVRESYAYMIGEGLAEGNR